MGGSGMKQARERTGNREGAKRVRNPGRADGSREVAIPALVGSRAENAEGDCGSLEGAVLFLTERDWPGMVNGTEA
jgi:hypothetical protein